MGRRGLGVGMGMGMEDVKCIMMLCFFQVCYIFRGFGFSLVSGYRGVFGGLLDLLPSGTTVFFFLSMIVYFYQFNKPTFHNQNCLYALNLIFPVSPQRVNKRIKKRLSARHELLCLAFLSTFCP